jgi:hypothetical protein
VTNHELGEELTRLSILILQDTIAEASLHGAIIRIETWIPFNKVLKRNREGTADVIAGVDKVGK